MRSSSRPNIDVDVIRPVVIEVAEDMPAGLVPHEPGLIPSDALIAEALDLGVAVIALRAGALRPFI